MSFFDEQAPRSRSVSQGWPLPQGTLLDARDGAWQERKREWLSLGIRSEVGRDENLLGFSEVVGHLTSVFDPVLCEIVIREYSPPAGSVLDPFAGGSVRGIVAEMLGRSYWGCELREEQVDANRKQREEIVGPEGGPVWVCGDSERMMSRAPRSDLVFTCPPYGDLERYSDDEADLSTLEYPEFLAKLGRILFLACGRLRPEGFAAIVVGDFRDRKTGFLRGFVPDTVLLFRSLGFRLWEEMVLSTPTGSLPLRVGRFFPKARKLGRTHQNLLVFKQGV